MQRIRVEGRYSRMAPWGVVLLDCVGVGTGLCGQQTASSGGEVHRVHGVVVNGVTNQPGARRLAPGVGLSSLNFRIERHTTATTTYWMTADGT